MKAILVAAAVFVFSSASFAGDFASERIANWHQWRGPNGDGVSPDGDPPTEWGPAKNVKWKVEIPGEGSATPIVWEDKVFVVTAVPGKAAANAPAGGGGGRGNFAPTSTFQFTVMCLDRATGDVKWKKVAADVVPNESRHQTNTYASGSPTTDGKHLWVTFGSQGIFCYDLEGNLVWNRDLGDMQTRNGFGEGSSPTLHENTLVVTWDHEGPSFITALDATTGEPKWKKDRKEPTTWATPFVVEHDGRTQVVTNGTNRVRSYDLETGELIWECGGQVTNPIPSPVLRDDIVYVTTGYKGFALFAIPLSAKGDITDSSTIAWKRNDGTPYIASPILYQDVLYTTKSRDAILTALDPADGKVLTNQMRLPDLGTLYASPVAAAGRLYYTDRDGTTLVLKAGEKPEVIATNKMEEGIDASPAIVGKQMFLRTAGKVYCLEQGR
jgi:outer membrane protein assembly factor BamB